VHKVLEVHSVLKVHGVLYHSCTNVRKFVVHPVHPTGRNCRGKLRLHRLIVYTHRLHLVVRPLLMVRTSNSERLPESSRWGVAKR
jgi:hypothetical protein